MYNDGHQHVPGDRVSDTTKYAGLSPPTSVHGVLITVIARSRGVVKTYVQWGGGERCLSLL